MADEQELDLVNISPGATPPVCKIMDYGKFKFEQQKREKEAKRQQHIVEIKEIRMSPVIDTNDFNVKVRNGEKFLREGDRLKLTVRFRGRQMAHTSIGAKVLERFAEALSEIAVVDKNPKLEGRSMSMFLSPKSSEKTKKGQKPSSVRGKSEKEKASANVSETNAEKTESKPSSAVEVLPTQPQTGETTKEKEKTEGSIE